jgi:Trk K+ transport system NAD-binding subunit
MRSRFHKLVVRSQLAVRQNRFALLFVALWLSANTAVFTRVFHLRPMEAALVAVCVGRHQGGYFEVYRAFTEVVVFGLIASVVLTNVTRKYRPEETCRALAEEASGHVVVVGWTNLGKRIVELAASAGKVAVVVEENAELVAALVRDEEPVVVGSPRERSVLASAGVARARVVIVATDDLESAAVACRLVREMNASCELVVRCADDDVGSVLARTYRARAVSTSRLAADLIQAHAVKLRAKKVVVFGKNSVGRRTTSALEEKRIAVSHVDSTSDPVAMTAAGVGDADLIVLCDDDLGDNLIRVDRIRDLNKRTRVICRAFHEEAAEILARQPFDCIVLSTSRNAADMLARAGVFREVGIDQPDARPKRELAAA